MMLHTFTCACRFDGFYVCTCVCLEYFEDREEDGGRQDEGPEEAREAPKRP